MPCNSPVLEERFPILEQRFPVLEYLLSLVHVIVATCHTLILVHVSLILTLHLQRLIYSCNGIILNMIRVVQIFNFKHIHHFGIM